MKKTSSFDEVNYNYLSLFLNYFALFRIIAALAAASLAIGTLNGEQDT